MGVLYFCPQRRVKRTHDPRVDETCTCVIPGITMSSSTPSTCYWHSTRVPEKYETTIDSGWRVIAAEHEVFGSEIIRDESC